MIRTRKNNHFVPRAVRLCIGFGFYRDFGSFYVHSFAVVILCELNSQRANAAVIIVFSLDSRRLLHKPPNEYI